jgi:septum formation protein
MSSSAQIILASASPRRRELLEQIGVVAIVQPVDIDETQQDNEPAIEFVQRLAMEKAQRGFETINNKDMLPILGSDTIVEVDTMVLVKPENRLQAKEMLELLSDRKHTVHSTVAIVTDEEKLIATSSTQVHFKALSEEEIDSYLVTGESDDKAGSYAIQGRAAQFIKNINGSYTGVMGLPLYETVQLLKKCGVKTLK